MRLDDAILKYRLIGGGVAIQRRGGCCGKYRRETFTRPVRKATAVAVLLIAVDL